jgi:hypothetical protein
MNQRDKHLELLNDVRLRLSYAKGKTKNDLLKHYKRLKKELNRYDNNKRQLTIPNHQARTRV